VTDPKNIRTHLVRREPYMPNKSHVLFPHGNSASAGLECTLFAEMIPFIIDDQPLCEGLVTQAFVVRGADQ
jgi:hypothetical protein